MKHVLFIVGILLLFIPTADNTPTPIPDPDVPPIVVKEDLWDKASHTYRHLTAEVFDEFAAKEFKSDDEKLKFIEEHTKAARVAAFTDVNQRLQDAVKNNTPSELSKALKAGELK